MRISDWSQTCALPIFDEVLRRLVLQRPVPVGGPEDALDVCAGTLRHQARAQRHHNREVLAVGLLVAQAEMRSEERRVGQGSVSTCRYRWSASHYQKITCTE